MGKASDRALEQRLKSLSQLVMALGQAVEVVMREQQAQAETLRTLADHQAAQRDDMRRGVDRVLGAVASAEETVAGEVRSVDARIGALAADLRLVRVLRDGLEALAEGVDGVRQLTARTATSHQMTEVTRELGAVLAEIELARSRVLRVEQEPASSDVVVIGGGMEDLGRRIDRLADAVEDRMRSPSPGRPDGETARVAAERLRRLSGAAVRLGGNVIDDVRARRGARR